MYVELIPFLACIVKCKKHLKINVSMFREAKWKIVHSVFLYQALWQTKNEKKITGDKKENYVLWFVQSKSLSAVRIQFTVYCFTKIIDGF